MSTKFEQELVKTQTPEEEWFKELSVNIIRQRESLDEVERLGRNLINIGDFCCVH